MGKLVKKYLLAFLLSLISIGTAYSAATKFTNVEVTGTLTVDGNQTNVGNQTVTGVITTSAATPYAIKIASTTAAIPAGTPTAANLLAVDNNHVLYISTGTTANSWVKVGSQ